MPDINQITIKEPGLDKFKNITLPEPFFEETAREELEKTTDLGSSGSAGMFETVNAAPTLVPSNLQNQVKIFVNDFDNPSERALYIYSVRSNEWIEFLNNAIQIKAAGVAKINTDILTLINDVHDVDMDGTESSMAVLQGYSSSSVAIVEITLDNDIVGNPSSLTTNHNVRGNDRVLVVCVQGGDSNSNGITSVTYGGIALTQEQYAKTVDNRFNGIWYLNNPAPGNADIVVTGDPGAGFITGIYLQAYTLNNCDTTNPVDTSNQFNAGSKTPSVSLTTSQNNNLIIDSVSTGSVDPGTFAANASQTERDVNENVITAQNCFGNSTKVATVAGAQTMDWSYELDGPAHRVVLNAIAINVKGDEGFALSGRITWGTETDWDDNSDTHDSYVALRVANSGTIQDVVEYSSTGIMTTKNTDGTDGLKKQRVSQSFDDDETLTLETGVAGWGYIMAGDNEESARFNFATDGTVELLETSANVADTDSDGNLCIYDSGSGVTIKNRLGSAKIIRFEVNYS